MKKILSAILVMLWMTLLCACGITGTSKNIGTLQVKNPVDGSYMEIKTEAEKVYFAVGEAVAFQYAKSMEELAEELQKDNPDAYFQVLNERQILMMRQQDTSYGSPYTWFTKDVVDSSGNRMDTVVVAVNENAVGNRNHTIISFPHHLTDTYYSFEEENSGYSLNSNLHDPFYNTVALQASPTIFTDLAAFFQDCNYAIRYEGGNMTGGSISVYPNSENPTESAVPLYQILVMKSGNRYAMQYCEGNVANELQSQATVEKLIDAINHKDAEAYCECYTESDKYTAEVILGNVKSCTLHNSEVFWQDQPTGEVILKVDYTLVSEDGRQMGSFGPGKVDRVNFWLMKTTGGESKIACQYDNFTDTISELSVYKEFETNEKENLHNWIDRLVPAE